MTEAANITEAELEQGVHLHQHGMNPGALDLVVCPCKILIVEDDHLIALDAEASLRQAGFEVVGIAASSSAALEMARQRQPDLVIMDIRLAGSADGIETAIELSKANLRCVFATSHGDAATRQRAAAATPLGWVAKPYRPEDLVRAVKRAFQALDR